LIQLIFLNPWSFLRLSPLRENDVGDGQFHGVCRETAPSLTLLKFVTPLQGSSST
jgi:hypothetical protein